MALADNINASYGEQIKNILEEEANQLAMSLDNLKDAGFPPRVEIAVHREIRRLRHLASWVESVGNFGSDEPKVDEDTEVEPD